MMEPGSHLNEKARRDYQLVKEAISAKNERAYIELFNNYRDGLYFMLLKMTGNPIKAEDLTMESFGLAFKQIERYTPEIAFSTWLFKIAANNAIDHLRKNKQTYSTSSPEDEPTPDITKQMVDELEDQNLDPEEQLIARENVKMMRDVIQQLKPHYRKLIVLRYLNEYSYEEIAEELHLSVSTVKAQVYRAREFLYQILTPQNKGKVSKKVINAEKEETLKESEKVRANVYLNTNDNKLIENVQISLVNVLADLEMNINELEDPLIGSWFQRFILKSKRFMERPDVNQRLNEVELILRQQTYLKTQSEINKNESQAVESLINSTKDIPEAIINVGSIMYLKKQSARGVPVIIIHKLSPEEINHLEKHRNLYRDPTGMFNYLSLNNDLQEILAG